MGAGLWMRPPVLLPIGGIGNRGCWGRTRFRRLEQFFQPDRMGGHSPGIRSLAEELRPDD